MKVKRLLAFCLAFLMLFGETTTALADNLSVYDVSGNEIIEEVTDTSEIEESVETLEEIVGEDMPSADSEEEEEEIKVVSVDGSMPTEFLIGIENVEEDFCEIPLSLTYSDGTTSDYEDCDIYFNNLYDSDGNSKAVSALISGETYYRDMSVSIWDDEDDEYVLVFKTQIPVVAKTPNATTWDISTPLNLQNVFFTNKLVYSIPVTAGYEYRIKSSGAYFNLCDGSQNDNSNSS